MWDFGKMYVSVHVVGILYVYIVGFLLISYVIGLQLLLKLKYWSDIKIKWTLWFTVIVSVL
jgi:hypothetical protein